MNNAEFNRNWDWQLKHIEQIKEILRSQAMHIVKIDIASPENDMKYATDLEVHVTGGDIAVRIRRDIPWRDLTIRAKNGNARTEIHKLRDGYADWYLYAWTINDLVSDWMLIDLNVMRNKGCFDENRPIIMNKDSFTGFVKYSLQELKSYNAVVATNIELPLDERDSDRKEADKILALIEQYYMSPEMVKGLVFEVQARKCSQCPKNKEGK